ncbi:MAG: hypothetical protein NTX25_20320, partial [Proteobacteria bacterium]|nr:hypothetical protein [Pseudomonadota bacterium]
AFSIFCLLLNFPAHAADLSPTSIEAFADPAIHLRQKPLANSEFRLNLGFIEANRYVIDPLGENPIPSKVIQRRLGLAIGLAMQTELGFTLKDTQSSLPPEDAAIYGSLDHASKPLGGVAWGRWHVLNLDMVSSSVTLQFEPGVSNSSNFHQASQDRSSMAVDLGLRPSSWYRTAVYGSYNHRQHEKYRQSQLGDETQFAWRMALGGNALGIFAETLHRQLEFSSQDDKTMKKLLAHRNTLGLYFGAMGLDFSAYAIIPGKNRYPGLPERGFGASLSMTIGSHAPSPVPPAVPVAREQAASPKRVQAEEVASPQILESSELDEFQLMNADTKKNRAQEQIESEREKAERDIRIQVEADRALEKTAHAAELKKQKLEREQRLEIMQIDEQQAQDYRLESDKEIEQFALPDQEDLNWSGLQNQ